MNRAQLKEAAKQQISGNIGMFFICMLITVGLSCLSFIPIIGSIVVGFVITPAISFGLAKIVLGMTNGEKVDINNLFSGFSNIGPCIVLYIMISIFTFLWSLLLVVPGIIKALSYSMSWYILVENPEMSPSEALNASKAMMDGHKADLFVLYLSFIPWFLLISVTFGIASIYVAPYMQTTVANFYLSIKNEKPGF